MLLTLDPEFRHVSEEVRHGDVTAGVKCAWNVMNLQFHLEAFECMMILSFM